MKLSWYYEIYVLISSIHVSLTPRLICSISRGPTNSLFVCIIMLFGCNIRKARKCVIEWRWQQDHHIEYVIPLTTTNLSVAWNMRKAMVRKLNYMQHLQGNHTQRWQLPRLKPNCNSLGLVSPYYTVMFHVIRLVDTIHKINLSPSAMQAWIRYNSSAGFYAPFLIPQFV